jgi:hypothetical protein
MSEKKKHTRGSRRVCISSLFRRHTRVLRWWWWRQSSSLVVVEVEVVVAEMVVAMVKTEVVMMVCGRGLGPVLVDGSERL